MDGTCVPIAVVVAAGAAAAACSAGQPPASPLARVAVVPGHPWCPPFGLERVGRPPDALVTYTATGPPQGRFLLVAYRQDKETSRQELTWTVQERARPPAPALARVCLEEGTTEVVLLRAATGDSDAEVLRQAVNWAPPAFEAEAVAQPDKPINPVDLGAILPPADWLVLAGGQKASVAVAALTRSADTADGQAVAWYESAPQRKVSAALPLRKGVKARVGLSPGACSAALEKDTLHVSITGDGGRELWHRRIRTMIVPRPPTWPKFGAVSTRLRYDLPILVAGKGKYESIDYEKGWDPALSDVVALFPNGARWVFWRGASYCPFWADKFNTGVSYEWAERFPFNDGIGWAEPLFDNELRYGRVEIVQSSAARVHVRWTYRPSNFRQRASVDTATEDFYFYPDGFGTRVLTLRRVAGTRYEMEEYIVLSPASAYPLEFQPKFDALTLDGVCRGSSLYRVRPNRRTSMSAICFSPYVKGGGSVYRPFYDKGAMVTPFYWGSHWPLNRGFDTGWSISDRVTLGPAANSLTGWGQNNPSPIRSATVDEKDDAGRPRRMNIGTYVWLIGMADANDEALRLWAQSYAKPPALEKIAGARLDAEAYAPERRALRLIVEKPSVAVTIEPQPRCINPVLELSSAPKNLLGATLDGKPLEAPRYAWDGRTFWLDAILRQPSKLELEFAVTER